MEVIALLFLGFLFIKWGFKEIDKYEEKKEKQQKPDKIYINHCMNCGERFEKPVQIYNGEFLCCQKCVARRMKELRENLKSK
ncbi:hypothetical protein [Mesonia mobilis]|uniref:hypothetical protein n=1 Tax=Mesonia mobilis TaxID=369791 RepID=UPI0024BB938A|nr:hypothetical protein [Mesonia mobilis]